MNADGTNQHRITYRPEFADYSPTWSPDGKKIAFCSEAKGSLDGSEIYVMDTDGKNITRLTNNRAFDTDPDWFAVSPWSKFLATWAWFKVNETY